MIRCSRFGVLFLFLFILINLYQSVSYGLICWEFFDKKYEYPSSRAFESDDIGFTYYEDFSKTLITDKTARFLYQQGNWIEDKKNSSRNLRDAYHPALSVVYITAKTHTIEELTIQSLERALVYISKDPPKTQFDASSIFFFIHYLKKEDKKSRAVFYQVLSRIKDILIADKNLIKSNPDNETNPSVLNKTILFLIEKNKDQINLIYNKLQSYSGLKLITPLELQDIKFLLRSFYIYYYGNQNFTSAQCSGIIVSHNTLITAAHCLEKFDYIEYQSESGKIRQSDFIIYNPKHNETEHDNTYDIGVVLFPDKTFITRPIRLSIVHPQSKQPLIAVGTEGKAGFKKIGMLQTIIATPSLIKAIHVPLRFSSTSGDSGGALINNLDELVGIISGHDRQTKETFFAPISQSIEFLRDVLKTQPRMVILGLDSK